MGRLQLLALLPVPLPDNYDNAGNGCEYRSDNSRVLVDALDEGPYGERDDPQRSDPGD